MVLGGPFCGSQIVRRGRVRGSSGIPVRHHSGQEWTNIEWPNSGSLFDIYRPCSTNVVRTVVQCSIALYRTLYCITVSSWLNHFCLSVGLNCALGAREMRPFIESVSTNTE